MQKEDTIKFDHLKTFVNIKDPQLFLLYLVELYKDLCNREEYTRDKGISLITFLDFFKLGFFIGEKLFATFDVDKDNFLKFKEFEEGVTKLYLGDYKETTSLLFQIYDFSQENSINKNDVKLLLSYLPIINTAISESDTEYTDQNDSMNEIDKIIAKTFEKKETLSYEEFLNAIENRASDIFLILLCFFYQNIPFNENNVDNYKYFKKKINFKIIHTPKSLNTLKTLPLPLSKFKASPYLSKFCLNKSIYNSDFTTETHLMTASHNDTIRMPNRIEIELNNKTDDSIMVKPVTDSPTLYLKGNAYSGINAKQNNHSIDSLDIYFEGYIYKISLSNHIKTYFLCLVGNEIYYYNDSNKDDLKGMHNLSGCFVDLIDGEQIINEKKFWAFQITLAKLV